MPASDTVAKCPVISTHLMSPCYTERGTTLCTLWTTPSVTAARNSVIIHMAMLKVRQSEAEILNILKLPFDPEGLRWWAKDF